jgi:ABC-type sugar transport system ATPase subunit
MRQTPGSAILEVLGLAYGFNGETLQHDVSFDVKRGSIFAIMGASGSGKSTLLKVLIGLQRPSAGEIVFGGVSYCSLGDPEHAEIGRHFGVLFQGGALWSSMTAAENVALPLPPESIRVMARLSRRWRTQCGSSRTISRRPLKRCRAAALAMRAINAALAAAVGLVPRIVDWVDVGETQRSDRADLRDVFAGLGPMEMRLAAGQHYHAPRRVRAELALVELVSQPDVKDAGDHRVNAVLRMPVRQHLGTGRQLDPNQIGSRLGRVADQDGEPCGWRKRWEGFPQDIFGMNDAESPLIGLMVNVPVNGVVGLWRVRHGGVPATIRSD